METLNLSNQLLQALRRAGINTLEELRGISHQELALLPRVGAQGLKELLVALQPDEIELRLRRDIRIAQIENELAKHARATDALLQELKRIKLA